jgi:hypothetical protein
MGKQTRGSKAHSLSIRALPYTCPKVNDITDALADAIVAEFFWINRDEAESRIRRIVAAHRMRLKSEVTYKFREALDRAYRKLDKARHG